MALLILKEGCDADQQAALDMIGHHPGVTPADAEKLLLPVTDLLMDPDPQVRYFARKARSQLERLTPAGTIPADSLPDAPAITGAEAGPLSRRDILLRKMRLGSRYVAFDAIERLTGTADTTLSATLLEYLSTETDPFKLSFLVKRLPRIPAPEIASAIEPFLRHPDPRIVANALEGLSLCRTPHLHDEFLRLADSPDNRIKASAVRTLFNYEPLLAERRIQEMLESPSIAMQDSGVYLLGALRPPRLNTLVEISLASKFPTIRLRALEIPKHPPSLDLPESALSEAQLTGRYAGKGLLTSLIVCAALLISTAYLPGIQSALLLLAVASLLIATTRNRPSSMLRAILSTGFAACLLWGDGPLLAVPALLALWHPVRDDSQDRLSRIATWTFSLAACLLSGLLAGRYHQLVKSAGSLGGFQDSAARLLQFDGFLFAFTAGWSYVLLNVDDWFSGPNSHEGRKRRLLLFVGIGLAVVVCTTIGRSWFLHINLATLGITDPAQLFRLPGK
ncbi:MAG TPA: hypothetical protein PKM25_05575 [Candidatus Ozemobacteraceae bacterium]|mgnify:CR=1 FL=1|nr:hypothetical protein [Candidatus Ozemobacteraceae bacterium]